MNDLEKIVYYYSPIFAALASLRLGSGHALREIFRVSLVALPRYNSRHGYKPDKVPTA